MPSSRYEEIEPDPIRSPLEPPPKAFPWKRVAAVLVLAAIGIGAAFGLDLCGLARGVGVSLDACAAPAPAPAPAELPKAP